MEFNRKDTRPLFDDEYVGEPAKRALDYIQRKRDLGSPVVGVYCGYAPLEVIKAMDCTVAVLCAFSNKTVSVAEGVLPGNLCPLIKSSYGFILTDTCPFFGLSDVVVAETTCDGKKKMYELIRDIKPVHVMDLPHLPDEKEAEPNWAIMIRKLQGFLEGHLKRHATDEAIEVQVKESNRRNRKMNRIFDFAARTPPVMNWQELYDLTFLAQPAAVLDLDPVLDRVLADLEKRVEQGVSYGQPGAPRVLITGCPVAGDATKVYRAIEEAGGVIVTIDSCTGMKAYVDEIEEDTGDPVAALARRYLNIPCACMTPNMRRLSELDRYIERFKPDAVVDVVLHACHGYNVESYKVMNHVKSKSLPFLHVETDYSMTDTGQLKTRIQALLEMVS